MYPPLFAQLPLSSYRSSHGTTEKSGAGKQKKKFKPEEITCIINNFNEARNASLPGSPYRVRPGGAKYMVIQGEAGAVIHRKKLKKKTTNAILKLLASLEVGHSDAHLAIALLIIWPVGESNRRPGKVYWQ